MRLLLSLLALSQATTSNWNWYESQIYFQYNGGAKNMMIDLFKDFGYPEEFYKLFDTATDDSIMMTIAGFTDSTKSDFETELSVGNSLYNFYAGILAGMTNTPTFDRTELEANAVSAFLIEKVGSSGSDLSIMTTLVNDYFDETVLAAQDYYDSSTTTPNENYNKLKTIVPLLGNVKKAIKAYSNEVGLSMSTGAMVGNVARVWGPVIENSFWVWENEVDKMEVGEWVYWSYVNFVDDVYYAPLIGLCEKNYGPFEAMRQMAVKMHQVTFLTRYLFMFDDETTDLFSLMFFGERGHYGYDWTAFLDQYFFQYTNYLAPLAGRIEGELHLHAMLFDGLIQDWFYGMIKGPVCGLADEE